MVPSMKEVQVKGYDADGDEFFEHWFTENEWQDADVFADFAQKRHAGSKYVVDNGTATRTFKGTD